MTKCKPPHQTTFRARAAADPAFMESQSHLVSFS